jgi:phthiocerol/phenolphthiocerol synthesis type-I polyketide synthase E
MNGRYRGDEIAIIGMAARFPGARDVEEFWRNLVGGVESITFLTKEQVLAAGEDLEEVEKPNYVPACPILEDMEMFDASFFGMPPREADIKDPQQRVFLECAYTAVQHAGYDPARFEGSVGVYGGIYTNRYAWTNVRKNRPVLDAVGGLSVEIGNHADYLATLVSYKLNLRGPSFTVATACSTSAVAAHLACQSLRNGECDMALAGGVEIELPHRLGYLYAEGGIFSQDGHCRAFDVKATGTVFGSGAGVIVLKRLEDAVRDRDHIHAVIRGSAVNNDGSQKVGFTAPSVEGQTHVIAEAYGVSGIEPTTVTYVEAHGTATALGDPIEVTALSQVFGAGTDRTQWCAIGSVKTNIGHMGPAAGVAAIIKASLALERERIPPSLHFEEANPKIDLANSPFHVAGSLLPWPRAAEPRRAGVSSFGIGGTNAHLVLEEAPPAEPSGASRPLQLLCVSAKTATALETSCRQLSEHLRAHPEQDLADVAYTLHVGREPMHFGRAAVCASAEDAARAFSGEDSHAFVAGQAEQHARPIAFMFSGQGAQYPNMGLDLYREEPTFRAAVDRCADVLKSHLGMDIREVLYPSADEEKAGELLGQTYVTQPALFVIEYALAQLWMEWGARPQAMIGHSIGEYVAACLAGVFSLEDALALVAARGALMQSMPAGSMLAVPLGDEDCRKMLEGTLSLAAVNAPALCVVSGPAEDVDAFAARLADRGVQGTRLRTSHAFHSRMMDPILAQFADRVRETVPQPPRIPFVSNLTGTWITAEQATDPAYWSQHVRETVRFADGVGELLKEQRQVLIEIGPGQTLMSFARQHPRAGTGRPILQSLRHPQKKENDQALMLTSLGRLWLTGFPVAWEGFYARERRQRVVLPTYPFERKRHWVDPIVQPKTEKRRPGAAERLEMDEWFSVPVWRQSATLRVGSLAKALTDAGPWLVFADAYGLATGLDAHLGELNGPPIVVTAGERFAQTGERSYTIDPRERADYATLLQTLRSAGVKSRSIVHLWTVSPLADSASELEAAAREQDLGFFSLCHLAQALAKHGGSDPVRLLVVSSGMQDVLGGEPISPAKAVVLGPCGALPKEQPNVACRSIDIRLPDSSGAHARVLEQLLAELAADHADEIVAYRGRRRWVRHYEPTRLPRPEGPIARLRERGVYLVTGGVGAVALTLGEHLAETARSRFVLVGRSRFLPREEWDAYVAAHPEGDRTSWQIGKLRAIERAGGEVLLLSADATDPEQMRGVVRKTIERFGQLNGVLHAAGVAGGGMLAVKTRDAAAKVLSPKVEGTLVLEDAVRDIDLDWFVSCASLVAVSGDFGLGDYCSANNVLNAIADRASRYGDRLTVSINWPAWLEVGMAVDASDVPQAFRELQKGSKFETIGHPLVDRRIYDNSGNIVFSTVLVPSATWILDEHRINGHSLLPGVGYVEMARAAFNAANGDGVTELRDVLFLAPLKVSERREVRAIFRAGAERLSFSIVAAPEGTAMSTGDWKEYSRGTVRHLPPEPQPVHDVKAILARCGDRVVTRGEEQRHSFVQVGPHWNNIRGVHVGQKEELAEIELPEELAADIGQFVLHPSQLDSATAFAQTQIPDVSYLPFGYSRIVVRGPLPRRFYSHIKYRETVSDFVTRDIVLMDPDGTELVNIEGFTLWRADPAAINASLDQDGSAAVAGGDEVLAVTRDRRRTEMAFGILPEEAVQIFDRILAGEAGPQVIICPEGLERKLERSKTVTQTRIAAELASNQLSAPVQTERSVANAYVAPESDLEKALAVLWQEALGVTQVGVEDDYFELGGNSLVAVQLASRVREKFEVEVSLPALFESPTVRRLAQVVEAALLEKVERMSKGEAEAALAASPAAAQAAN